IEEGDEQLVLAFASLSVISLAAALDATSLSVALSVMAAELNSTTVEAFWSGTSFLVTSTVFQPFYVSLSDIFGRKQLILVALLHFTAGSLIAALAKNFSTILVGRSFQGVGAGGIISLTEVIITDMVPLRDRGKWFGYISGMWAIGSVSGPIVGGAFTQKASWRWIFWMNLPVIGVGYFMIILFLKLHPASSLPLMRKFRQVDWLGALLFSASLTSVLIPISWGGVMYPWSHALTLVPLILGLGGLIVFTVYELHVAREPMVRFSIFKNWTLRLVYLQTTIHGVILWDDDRKISAFRFGLSSTIKNRLAQQLELPSSYPQFLRAVQKLSSRSGTLGSSNLVSNPSSRPHTANAPPATTRYGDPMDVSNIDDYDSDDDYDYEKDDPRHPDAWQRNIFET
ncbi:hypothetical protein IFR05_016965, partial [Cadophora sp. M221]